jgi:hypothetical protein
MKNAAHPTRFRAWRRRGRNVLANIARPQKAIRTSKRRRRFMRPLNSPENFFWVANCCQTIYELANVFAVNRHENFLCIRVSV